MTDLGPIEGEYERDYWEDPQTQAENAIARRDRRIAELEAAWDRYRHDIAELTAQVEQLTAERNLLDERYGLFLARAERAEAVIEQVRKWAAEIKEDTSSPFDAGRCQALIDILDATDTGSDQ